MVAVGKEADRLAGIAYLKEPQRARWALRNLAQTEQDADKSHCQYDDAQGAALPVAEQDRRQEDRGRDDER
jgi:hypothetical protein